MRQLTTIKNYKVNPLWRIYQIVKFSKVLKNTLIIEMTKFIPAMSVKRWLYCHLLKMTIGQHTSMAYQVMIDIFYPELISIGDNTVVGYRTTILTHEALVNEFRYGPVTIGSNTLIGAHCIILPGIRIGNNVTIAAGSVVTKDVPDHAFVYGNPMYIKKN
ncbi:acyltransferase [Staphylococcus simiae]|uniref:acyltransferase n=1 Tax=Staphylococcus simiae TaxID=308354 RepID=UPI001F605753|nr:acyltransferase [Staphylococcus simiae]